MPILRRSVVQFCFAPLVRFHTALDTIEKEIGYRPEWTLERGIRETVNAVRTENGLEPV